MAEQPEDVPVEQPPTEEAVQQQSEAAEPPPAEATSGREEAAAEQPPSESPQEGGTEVKSEDPPVQTQDPPKEEVKSKEPALAPKPAPEFHVVKEGFVERQGLLWKKWNRQWMTLDEGGAALRWYTTNTRDGNDGTLYMNKCAEVCDPRDGITTSWPAGVEDRCFVVCSPNRAHYIVAETKEDKEEWVAKLTEAKGKYNTTGVGIVSVDLFSIEALKVSISSEIERTQSETDRTLTSQGTSTEQIGKSLDSAVQDAEKELKKDQTAQQVVKETEQVSQQVESEVKAEVSWETGEGGEVAVVEVQVMPEQEATPAEEGAGKEE